MSSAPTDANSSSTHSVFAREMRREHPFNVDGTYAFLKHTITQAESRFETNVEKRAAIADALQLWVDPAYADVLPLLSSFVDQLYAADSGASHVSKLFRNELPSNASPVGTYHAVKDLLGHVRAWLQLSNSEFVAVERLGDVFTHMIHDLQSAGRRRRMGTRAAAYRDTFRSHRRIIANTVAVSLDPDHMALADGVRRMCSSVLDGMRELYYARGRVLTRRASLLLRVLRTVTCSRA